MHVPQLANPQHKNSEKTSADAKGRQAERTYVLDTSVLLSDPKAIFRFAEHAVVLPVIVVTELESKRNDPEIGFFARQALRNLDELRVLHERLDFPIAVGDGGGSLRVELNHSNMAVLPSGLQLGTPDSRILAVALNLSNDGLDGVVVSKDLPLRVKAASIGNLKQTWTNDKYDFDWFDSKQCDGRYFMRRATQIKNIWVPYGE